jgi:hypothetical protein
LGLAALQNGLPPPQNHRLPPAIVRPGQRGGLAALKIRLVHDFD